MNTVMQRIAGTTLGALLSVAVVGCAQNAAETRTSDATPAIEQTPAPTPAPEPMRTPEVTAATTPQAPTGMATAEPMQPAPSTGYSNSSSDNAAQRAGGMSESRTGTDLPDEALPPRADRN